MTVAMYSDVALWKAAATGWSEDTAYGTNLATIHTLTLSDGTILGFIDAAGVEIVNMADWGAWSGGYTGQVLYSNGNSLVHWSVTATGGCGMYIEPLVFGPFNVILTTSDGGTLTQSINEDGTGKAKFFGWIGNGVTGFTIQGVGTDFAVGDLFSTPPPVTPPVSTSCCEDPVVVDAEVVALLSQRQLRVAHLVQFDFLTTPKYLWNGFRDLATGGSGGDHTWQGLRNLGGIEGLEESADLTASQMKFTLSGVNAAILALAIGEDRDEYVGRLVTVWLQFFDADWQNVGDPIARACGIMDGLEISGARDGDGGSVRTLTLTAENIFYGRGVPPAGNYTDADQQFRFPGDRGLQFVNEVQNTVIQVPW